MKKGFFRLLPSKKAKEKLMSFRILEPEEVLLCDALDRVLSNDISSPEDLPPFSRSTMDGYAIMAEDSFGASESEPAIFKIKGEIKMGQVSSHMKIKSGEAVKIWTGGMLPENANAVVMLEYTQELKDGTLEVYKSVAPFENVILKGEDATKGQKIFNKGHVLRPQDLGLLAGLGINKCFVTKKPKVVIISTGDEIVPKEETPPEGKIRDINSTTLYSLCKNSGAMPSELGIVKDNPEILCQKIELAIKQGADIVLVSGGSSVGSRDFTLEAFRHICQNEPLVQGVSIRPGKPTIISKKGNVALFGLPGHVASCIVVYFLFVHFLIYRMLGKDPWSSLRIVKVRCGEMIPSVIGREDFVRVIIKEDGQGGRIAYPIYGKSGLISTLVRANGLLVIPRDTEGLYEGEEAEVIVL